MTNYKKITFTLFLLLLTTVFAFAQNKGTVTGKVLDLEMNDEPMPFANVYIKSTEIGSTTDFDGFYTINTLPGTYSLVFSFIGYETIEINNVVITEEETVTLKDVSLGATEGVALEAVTIKVSSKKESFQSLLGEQKKAIEVKTSIGAEELSQKSVGDAAGAVAKISGVSKEEGSSNVYVRGLGDRYLNTTLNGLSLPSNSIDKKNIDLDLFTTDIIENVSISKSYSPHFYSDFSAGNVNIDSKSFTGDRVFELSFGSGVNSYAIGQDRFIFYNRYNHNPFAVVLSHGIDPVNAGAPIGANISGVIGKSFDLNDDSRLSLFISGSYENDFSFQEGSAVDYTNTYNKIFPSTEEFNYSTNTTLLASAIYKIDNNHKITYNSLFSNSSTDKVAYFGTEGNGFYRESRSQVDTDRGFYQMNVQFNQDMIFVNQLLGKHTLNEKLKLDWGIGYNKVYSNEPDRKRVSLEDYFFALDDDQNTNPVFLTNNSFDNQRYFQKMTDDELNGRIKFSYQINEKVKLNYGYNGRLKTRDFENIRYGYKNFDDSLVINDVNNLNEVFNIQNVLDSLIQTDVFRALTPQNGVGPTNRPGQLENTYNGNLEAHGGYISFEINLDNKWLIVPGFRAESFLQEIDYDVINLVNNPGSSKVIEEFYLPSINIKYALNDDQNLRLSASKTVSTPEFKEMAPIVYEGVTQRIGGNPDLLGRVEGNTYENVKDISYSDILNIDVKYENFIGQGQVLSLAAFTKQINNPINLVVANDATGTQRYFRTGDKATVYGVELEYRKHLLLDEEENGKLTFGFNGTYMYTEQDLYSNISGTYSTSFNKNTEELQGASPLILNADLSYKSNLFKDVKSTFNLVGNYYSDRISALGSGQLGNVIEKGVVSLDFILKNKISEKSELNFTAKNLLNPKVQQVRELTNQEDIILSSFQRGINIGIQYKYKF